MNISTLPIYQVEHEFIEAIERHRVVIVEGSTGSGKTTQIPRILRRHLESRCIAVTQPRRIAAVSVAWRIAAEEQVELGQEVGFGIRFDDQSSAATRIKIMTDGLLLSEARADPDLSRYDVIMVDEAHERSLNIDVTLGLLYQILQRRSDLKVVISSATLAPKVYQQFFAPIVGHVPVVRVHTAPHPVDVIYSPPSSYRAKDIVEHITQLIIDIHEREEPGHILVFLPGEGLIKRISTALEDMYPAGAGPLVLPLYGRLKREEQERVFQDFGAQRKVVLATNIAETSITIAGVRYVVDSGIAKVPRFKPRSGITQLREEPISQASVLQRTGRAGRTGPGVVWRLFNESTLHDRPEHTEEEIRRLNLAEVVLRLLELGVEDVNDFPFLTPPPKGKLRAALEHLFSLGAVDDKQKLTRIGRRMAPFPLTPALARMVIEAAERFSSVVDDVLIVGAFMSGRAPWALPENAFNEARKVHAGLHHPLGDACTLLNVYRAWERSGYSERYCIQHYLDIELMQFTRKAHEQLRDLAGAQGIEPEGGGPLEHVVKAVATGLADKLLRRDGYAYQTLSGARVYLHPSCALLSDPPDFAVAAELVAFARPYAINVSLMRPAWIKEVNPQAARSFGLGRVEKKAVQPTELKELTLGGVVFAVRYGHGKPTIDIQLEELEALRGVDPSGLPKAFEKIRGRVRWTKKQSFAAARLPKLLDMLAHAPFPAPDSHPPKGIQLGDLQDVDRGRHYIEKSLKHLLKPAAQGKRAGWVALVANGVGGYWLDLVSYYVDALQTTVASLSALSSELCGDDDFLVLVDAVQRDMEGRSDQMSALREV